MNELIKISEEQIGNETVNTVNARELWMFLGSKREFSTWIKERIEKYDFMDGTDFIRVDDFVKGVKGGFGNKTNKEYHISMDMAKELSMVENNDQGKKSRKYFIEAEKQLRSVTKELSRKDLALMVVKAEEEKERLQIECNTLSSQKDDLSETILQNAHKVQGFDDIINHNAEYTVEQASGLISGRGKKISRNGLWAWLRSEKIVKSFGNEWNQPYQSFKDKGWFMIKMVENKNSKRTPKARVPQPFITGKGLIEIYKLWSK